MNYNHFPCGFYYMNLETGELLTRAEMFQQAEEMYEFDEYTPICELWECYELTDIPVRLIEVTNKGKGSNQ